MPFAARRTVHRIRMAALAVVLMLGAPQAKAGEDVWPALRQATFGDRAIEAEDGAVTLEAPEVADDAAVVPITVKVPFEVKQKLKSLTLIVDKNPDPVVAVLSFGPAAGAGGTRFISTRLRIDNFSNVRAILETADGKLHMATRFVVAAGGCAAMQAKDPDTENVDLGKMIVKTFPAGPSTMSVGQVMIKHPNANGMQLDINTGDSIPARFVKEMVVKRRGELVFRMESTFSISTNPNFRFTFGGGADDELDVAIVDTAGAVFTAKSQPSGS